MILETMILVCNDIIDMLCETLINIKIQRFELSFPANNYLFNNRNSRKSYEMNMFKVNNKDTRATSLT